MGKHRCSNASMFSFFKYFSKSVEINLKLVYSIIAKGHQGDLET